MPLSMPFLNAIKNKTEVSIPEVLKGLKDGKQLTLNGKLEGGGWIRDLGPKIQSKASEILKREGYKLSRPRVNGRQLRIWTKKNEGDCPF